MNNMKNEDKFIIFKTEDEKISVDVRFEDEAFWLTIDNMAKLLEKSRATINEHILNIYAEGELAETDSVRKIGNSDFSTKPNNFYNLDVIISVGYRVKSLRGTQFRQWATKRLNEYIRKGFTMDDERLKDLGGGGYWKELLQRIRDIRASGKVFYRQVLDIYATSIDYDPKADVSIDFFKLNSQILELYWEIAKEMAEKQKNAVWGSNLVETVANELHREFPEIKGFSRRNVYAMVQWFNFYSAKYPFVTQHVAQIPWGHNRLILAKTSSLDEAEYYCLKTLENNWDRDTLEVQINSGLFHKEGKIPNNFALTLPESQSLLAKQTFKDPYNFDFLGLENDSLEKSIEDELVKNITAFMLELGKGFAFLGNQYKIEIGETDYFIDMLFYHIELHCYIVVELKAGKFKSEYAGKLNYYLSAIDTQLRKDTDNPTIGIILCKMKNKIDVEYALRDIHKPKGVSEYHLTNAIPDDIKAQLPSAEELEEKIIYNLKEI
jgi:predicted nuclease of restriction endonuclease-like (RecB) superfamily